MDTPHEVDQTNSSFPSSEATAPCRANGPIIPGLCIFLHAATNCSPILNIFSTMLSLVVTVICPVSINFGFKYFKYI